jgi:hypothetical protein
MPIRANLAPMPIAVAVQNSEAILVTANSAESTPTPLVLAMEDMKAFDQVPISANHQPPSTTPASQNSHAVDVTANALCLPAPEPATCTVTRIAAVQFPIRSDVAPMLVPEPSQNAKAVDVTANSSILAPEPSVLAMQLVPVVVAPPELPVFSLHNPTRTCPSFVDAMAIQVISNAAVAAP